MANWRELAQQRMTLWERANALANKPNAPTADLDEVDRLLRQMHVLDERIGMERPTSSALPLMVGGDPIARQRAGANNSNDGGLDMEQDDLDPQALRAAAGRVPNYRKAFARSNNRALQFRASDDYERAFSAYIRGGVAGLDRDERAAIQHGFTGIESRDQVVGTNASGGFVVPPSFLAVLFEAQLAYGGMRGAAQIIHTDIGSDMPIPSDNDTAQSGAILAEIGAIPAQDIGSFAQTVLHAFLYTSKLVKVSFQLMQDSFFDLNPYLARKLGLRLARAENLHFTTGTGTGQPNGAMTAATLGKQGLVGETLTIIYDDIADLIHSIDPLYRADPSFALMMNDQTLKVLRKLKDSQGRPLFFDQSGIGAMAQALPSTLMGYRYVLNPDLAVPAASTKTILAGAFANYIIRQALDPMLIRLDERYADTLEVGFLMFERVDGNLVDAGTHPLKYFQQSAT
jgi:HK97 family phage major capsid protein